MSDISGLQIEKQLTQNKISKPNVHIILVELELYLKISCKTFNLGIIVFAFDQFIENVFHISWWHKTKTCKHPAKVSNHWVIAIVFGKFVF